MRQGVLQVTYELLERVLNLPKGVIITRTFEDPRYYAGDTLFLVVQGEDTPVVYPGQIIPQVELEYTKHDNGTVTSRIR